MAEENEGIDEAQDDVPENSEDTQQERFTKDEVESLINEKIEAIRKEYTGIQSGLQRKLNETEKRLQEKEAEGKSLEEQTADRVAKLEQDLVERDRLRQQAELRAYATELLAADGVKTKLLDRLIGEDRESTERLVTGYLEERKEQIASERKAWDARHGIKPRSTEQDGGGKLSDAEVERIITNPDGTINVAAYEKIRDKL